MSQSIQGVMRVIADKMRRNQLLVSERQPNTVEDFVASISARAARQLAEEGQVLLSRNYSGFCVEAPLFMSGELEQLMINFGYGLNGLPFELGDEGGPYWFENDVQDYEDAVSDEFSRVIERDPGIYVKKTDGYGASAWEHDIVAELDENESIFVVCYEIEPEYLADVFDQVLLNSSVSRTLSEDRKLPISPTKNILPDPHLLFDHWVEAVDHVETHPYDYLIPWFYARLAWMSCLVQAYEGNRTPIEEAIKIWGDGGPCDGVVLWD